MRISRARRLLAAGAAALFLFTLTPAAPIQGQAPPRTRVQELTATVHGEHVIELPMDASHIAVHWPGQPNAEVEIAFSSDGGSFGPPQEVEVDEVGEARRDGRTYGTVMVADGVKAVRITSDRPLPQVSVLMLDTGDAHAAWAFNTATAAVQPAVLSRAQWGANESLRFDSKGAEIWEREFYPIQKMVVHHTAGANNDPNPAATVRAIYYYHAVTQGWGDIGYNFLIDEAGRVYEGRYSRPNPGGTHPTGTNAQGHGVVGGHARTYNAGTVGVALLGTLETRAPTAAARSALVRTLAWAADLHGVYPRGATTYVNPINGNQRTFANISGHGDLNATACPGAALYAQLPTIRNLVAGELISRGSGRDRYEAAAHLSASRFAPGVPVAYIATGQNFPDALGAGPAAARHGGPVLLVRRDDVPPATASELQRLRPQRIVIVGGPVSISAGVEQLLRAYHAGGGLMRLTGADRYDAAAAVSATAFSPGVPVAFVATGQNYPDALSASAAGGRLGGPVLLTTRDILPQATRNELGRLQPRRIVVLGGTASVSESVRSSLTAYTSGSVSRIGGQNRYDVAAGVSATSFGTNVPVVYVTTGENFPDALGAGPVAALRGGPVLLVRRDAVPAVIAHELKRLRPLRVVVIGGPASVSDAVYENLRQYAGG